MIQVDDEGWGVLWCCLRLWSEDSMKDLKRVGDDAALGQCLRCAVETRHFTERTQARMNRNTHTHTSHYTHTTQRHTTQTKYTHPPHTHAHIHTNTHTQTHTHKHTHTYTTKNSQRTIHLPHNNWEGRQSILGRQFYANKERYLGTYSLGAVHFQCSNTSQSPSFSGPGKNC